MWTWPVGLGCFPCPRPPPTLCPVLLELFDAPWPVGCRLHCLHVLREKLHQEQSGVKGLARDDVTWKRRQQKQKEVAPAGVNPMSAGFSPFVPKALACLLLFLAPLAVLHGKRFSSPLPTAETLKTSSLSFVLEVSTPPFWGFLVVFICTYTPSFSPFPHSFKERQRSHGWEWLMFGFLFFLGEAVSFRGWWVANEKQMGNWRSRQRLQLCKWG